jgi:glucosamine--fructose-6-phosphate aminotransferase (isomerizing)
MPRPIPAAEVLHGPVALVEKRFPVIGLCRTRCGGRLGCEAADGLSAKGALAFITSDEAKAARRLPFVATGHPITDALALIMPFYGFVESWSRSRGFNPDAPSLSRR